MTDFRDLPYELQCEIFGYVDLADFLEVCCVCGSWNRAMNDSTTWIGRFKKKKIYVEPGNLQYILPDRTEMMAFYILQSKTNLLRNVNVDHGVGDLSGSGNLPPNFDHWHYHYGNWEIVPPTFRFPFPAEVKNVRYSAGTSYFRSERKQRIDLSIGYPNIENLLKKGYYIKLYWNVWVSAHYDFYSKYGAYILFEEKNAQWEAMSNDRYEELKENDSRILLGKRHLPAGRKYVPNWIKLSSTLDLDPAQGTSFTYYETCLFGSKIINPTITVRILAV